jgi:uncharacterized membrane protein
VLTLLLPLTIVLAVRRGRTLPLRIARYRLRPRMGLHERLGFGIAALAVAHALIATGSGVALRAGAAGIYLATGALALVFVQVFLGLLLREPSLRRRPTVRRRHVWGMIGLVMLALGHIVLNSTLLHRLAG